MSDPPPSDPPPFEIPPLDFDAPISRAFMQLANQVTDYTASFAGTPEEAISVQFSNLWAGMGRAIGALEMQLYEIRMTAGLPTESEVPVGPWDIALPGFD